MKKLISTFIFTALTISFMACKSTTCTDQATRIEPVTQDTYTEICNRQWIARKIVFNGNEKKPFEKAPFLEFNIKGRIAGFASVNRFFGNIKIDADGNVKISPLGSTRMAGPPELMNQEMEFLSIMQKTAKLYTTGNDLHAETKDKSGRIVFSERLNTN